MSRKFLKPDRFDIAPNVSDSKKQYKHWKKTFENFMAAVVAEDANANKLQVLTNFVSSTVYSYFEGSNTYEHAFEQLDKTYSKPKMRFSLGIYCLRETNSQGKQSTNSFVL